MSTFRLGHTLPYRFPNLIPGQGREELTVRHIQRFANSPRYRRTPRLETLPLPLDFREKPSVVKCVPGTDDALRVHATLRSSDADESVISMMLVNHHQTTGTGTSAYRDCFFQAEIEVRDAAGRPVFSPIERPTGNSLPEELKSLSLLYRHRRTFCLGPRLCRRLAQRRRC